ncbi:hypothetical protein BH09BAC4_BH09BAC4_46110 [soil metagenome]
MIVHNRLYNAIILLILVGIVGGCQTNNDPAPNDTAYFPLEIGDYWVYQVTQANYAIASPVVNTTYQLQEKIASSYAQNGQLFFVVEESIKKTEQSGWQLNGIHTVYKNLTEVVSQERNVPVVKMVFPISAATSWNVNEYNANPDTLLKYQDNGKAFAVGKLSFNQTVSVVGTNDSTLVNQEKYRQVYAQNIGLIYQENASLAYCQSSADCIGKAIIESGTRKKIELLSSNRLP